MSLRAKPYKMKTLSFSESSLNTVFGIPGTISVPTSIKRIQILLTRSPKYLCILL